MKLTQILIWLLTLSSFVAQSQNPYSYIINKSNGLPSNAVYDIYQDTKGFQWFATGEGLCKYDGIKFSVYATKKQTSKSGSNVTEDKLGRIWYINFDGFLYYVYNEQLIAFNQKNSIGYYEFGIIGDKLFTIQKNVIEVFNIKNLKLIKRIQFDNTNFKATHVSKKYFYVFTNKLLKLDSNLNLSKIDLPNELINTKSIVIESNKEDLYIVSKTDGHLYHYSKNKFKKEATLKGSIIQNLNFVDNQLWLATTSGLYKLEDNSFKNYYKELNISTIFKDQENKYWVSTLTNGLLYIPNFSSILWKCNYKPITLNSDDNKLLIGYENDILSQLDLTNFEEKFLFKGSSNHEIYKIYKDKTNYFITSNNFKIINSKLKEVNIAIKDIVKIDAKYYAFAASGLCGIFSLNNIKKSNWNGVYSKHFTSTPSNLNEAKLIIGVRGKSVAYNPTNNSIYFATNVGLFAQDSISQKEIKYKNKPLYAQKLVYHNNFIYILSNENELLKINSKNKIFNETIHLKTITDDIKSIKLIDNDIYVFTSNAIFQYHLTNKKLIKIQNITPDISVSDITTINNKIILATSSGLIIKSNSSLKEEFLPRFILNQVLINNKLKKSTSFKFNENNLSFDFSVLAYLPNTKFPISYKINDGNWIILEDNQRSLKLSSLASGDYYIQFKIENLEKTDRNIINYHFTIQKPFWESSLFITLCLFLLLILFYLIYKIKIKKLKEKNKLELNRITLENNLNQSKLTAIKSQMNPHFFYNALNTIQSYILSNDKKEAITYLNKFSSLTRIILELTEKNYLSIQEEINTISLYLDLEKARFFNDFKYNILIDKEIDTETVKIPSMLLQPFIENAIKHGLLHLKGEKKLGIEIRKELHGIEIIIDDNGIGRKRSDELNQMNRKNHISFATNAIEKRLKILNYNKIKKIEVQYIDKYKFEESIGTTVIIKIPTTWK